MRWMSHTAVAASEAAEQAPSLAAMLARARASQACWQAVAHMVPAALRAGVQAGPLDDEGWCLLVPNTTAAAKLRQFTPALLAALQAQGHAVQQIRWKVRRAA